MNHIKILLGAFSLLLMNNFCFASGLGCMDKHKNDLHSPLLIDDEFTIRFEMAKSTIDPQSEVFPIVIIGHKCDTGRESLIAELPYLGDPGKVESAFLADSDFDGDAELFVIHKVTLYSDTGTNYGSDYFTTLVYNRLTPLNYELNERISNYFGSGGDIFLDSTSSELIYSYPYKSELSIKAQLSSKLYKDWFERKNTTTKILNKAYLHNHANTADRTSRYLIPGDKIYVLNQSAGWFEILFHNEKKGDIKGWIMCKETLECTSPH